MSVQPLFRHAGLINMPWLYSIKTRREQQKEPNYLKNKLFSKSSSYFWNVCKELPKKTLKKHIIFRAIFRKCSLRTLCQALSFLIGLQLCYKETPAQLFSCKFFELSRWLLLSIATICQEHVKLNVRRMRAMIYQGGSTPIT